MGAAGTQARTPPPPVKQNVSLGTGCQTCPQLKQGDCTAHVLKVTVTTYKNCAPGSDPGLFNVKLHEPRFHAAPVQGTPKPRELAARMVMKGKKTAIRDWEVAALLTRYDLVIDALAEGPSRDEPRPRNRIALSAKVVYTGTCSVQTHPVIYEIPLDDCPELPPGGAFWPAMNTEERKFYAPSFWGDTVASTSPFGFFMSLLQQLAAGPKRIEVTTKACGATYWLGMRRYPDAVLNCLVRVYRKDKWALKLKIASYKTVSYKKSSTTTGWGGSGGTKQSVERASTTGGRSTTTTTSGGNTSTAVQHRSLTAAKSTTTTTTTDPKGNLVTVQDRDIEASRHQEFVVTRDGKAPAGDGWEKLGDGYVRQIPQKSPPPRVDLSIKRNDQELKILEDLRKFIEGVATIRDTIAKFGDLLKKAPQCGWSFGYSFSFLEGSVEGELERCHIDAPVEGRYYPVGWEGKVTFQLMLVQFSATASFGVKFDLGWLASAEATLSGTFKTEIPLKGTVDTAGDCEIGLHPKVTAEVAGVLQASAVGVSLVEVRVVLSGGITIMDEKTHKKGGLTWKKGKGFGFRGDLCSTHIVVKVVATSAAGGMQPIEHVICDPKKLMTLTSAPPNP